jgi:hypothetical protein
MPLEATIPRAGAITATPFNPGADSPALEGVDSPALEGADCPVLEGTDTGQPALEGAETAARVFSTTRKSVLR